MAKAKRGRPPMVKRGRPLGSKSKKVKMPKLEVATDIFGPTYKRHADSPQSLNTIKVEFTVDSQNKLMGFKLI